nr:hypothetical protein [Tanacetum cinerariifolium]
MGSYQSKEDEVLKISSPVFVANFPDSFGAKDLWNTCKQYGGNSGDTYNNSGVKGASNSYAYVVKGSQNSKMDLDSSPVMVLDDSYLNEKDYSLCMMCKVKDFATLANLKVVLANEGFDNIKFKYMRGRVTWVEIEEVPNGKDVKNVEDLKGDSDGEIVPDTKFEEDFSNQKGEKYSVGQGNVQLEDPFNIYEILNHKRSIIDKNFTSKESLKYPPRYTPTGSKEATGKKQFDSKKIRRMMLRNLFVQGSFDFAAAIVFSKPYSFRPCCLIGVIGGVSCASIPYLILLYVAMEIVVFVCMERGFLDSGDKKKKKDGDGVKKDAMDEAANVGIAVNVKFIDGKLRKPICGAPITMDVPAMGSIKGRDSHLEKVHTYVGGPPTKSILKKTDYEKGEARNGGKNTPTKVRFGPISTSTIAIPADAEGSSNGGTCEAITDCSFASLVRTKESSTKVHFRALVNDEKLESFDCVLPKAAASKITRNDDGVYLFKFASNSGMGQVLEKGPWLIRKSPIILNNWTPSVSLKKGEVANVPVWVKMYNVSVPAYSEDGLSLSATQIGKPIMLDAFTSSMYKEIIMAVPEDEGDGYVKEVIRIEYEWKPPHCVDCQSFGHDSKLFPKRVREEVPNNSARVTKATTMEDNDDGFTEVKSRKKKKGVDFGGIRLNKPKSKVMWQQKKGVDAKSNSTSPSASSNVVGNDKGVSNSGLNTSNPFDVLNVDGDAMGESETQPK